MTDLFQFKDLYGLDYCVDWILQHRYRKVALQLKAEALTHSVDIIKYLEDQYRISTSSQDSSSTLDLYVSQSTTCCLDLLVTQHVSNLDAIINIGDVCLSKPVIKNEHADKPILFAFGRPTIDETIFSRNIDILMNNVRSVRESITRGPIVVLYDVSLIDYAKGLEDLISREDFDSPVHIAGLYRCQPNWHTTSNNGHKFLSKLDGDSRLFGNFVLARPKDYYCGVIYLGQRPSIELALDGPSKLFRINCHNNFNVEEINVSKLLNRRIGLVERLKEEEELRIGIIITNPLPDISDMMKRLEECAKPRRHTLYFISMVQTIDECKIGNFDLCDAFVVVNSCTCSTILESLVFNRPLINELEFKLACGFEAEYGRVLWPGSSSHLSEDDMINKRRVSDVSLALIHTRNELLERCSQSRTNKWSGLEYKASVGEGCDNDASESLKLEDGLSGIASSYSKEPPRE